MEFSLIMVFTEDEKTEKVLDASRAAGATGATIITRARGLGLHKTEGVMGLELFNMRDVILILAEKKRADDVLEAVSGAGGLDESAGTGIALQLEVSKALGLMDR